MNMSTPSTFYDVDYTSELLYIQKSKNYFFLFLMKIKQETREMQMIKSKSNQQMHKILDKYKIYFFPIPTYVLANRLPSSGVYNRELQVVSASKYTRYHFIMCLDADSTCSSLIYSPWRRQCICQNKFRCWKKCILYLSVMLCICWFDLDVWWNAQYTKHKICEELNSVQEVILIFPFNVCHLITRRPARSM
jgi:hypothetical protein